MAILIMEDPPTNAVDFKICPYVLPVVEVEAAVDSPCSTAAEL
jgi:hypothetical protein